MRVLALVWLLLAATARALPVYIEDSHAGSFYWIATHGGLERPCTLVLVDAHSDASELFDSDQARHDMRAHPESVESWRARGVVQCYNWIEPLMPRPIERVVWIAGDRLSPEQLASKRREVAREINAHEEAVPRREGDLSGRWVVTDRAGFRPPEGPVIASVDLDYCADGAALEPVLDTVLGIGGLQAVTLSISRPYLASEEQSHALLERALRHLSRVVNLELAFEPFAQTGEDRSRRARELQAAGLEVPRYRVERAPASLRALFVQLEDRLQVRDERWPPLLASWRAEAPRVEAPDFVSDREPLRVRLVGPTGGNRVWKVLVSDSPRYNLVGRSQDYAEGAGRLVRWHEVVLPATGTELGEADLLPFLDPRTGWGTLRVGCEVDGCPSNLACLSRFHGEGYLGHLTEIFNLPYIYGSALLPGSADRRWGADCAHFLIYGWRREGHEVPYGNPEQLLPYLEELDVVEAVREGVAWGRRGPIQVEEGTVLHFGKHVAAVFRAGTLREETPVVHQLEDVPEITTFGALAARYTRIRIMRLRAGH